MFTILVTGATAAQIATLNNAITTATNARSTVQTAAAAASVAATLDAATTNFENLSRRLGSKVRIDLAAIDLAITSANSAKSGILTSANGSDINTSQQWVTSEQLATLDQAILAASSARGTVQSVEAVNAAVNALNSAVILFNSQKPPEQKLIRRHFYLQ